MNIGKIIKSQAVLRNIKLMDLAQAINKDPTHFAKQLNGKRPINTSDLEKISKELGLKPSQLYEKVEQLAEQEHQEKEKTK